MLVDIRHLLPHRVRDLRLVALSNAFGQKPFSASQAVEVLGGDYDETWRWLFDGPADDLVRVAIHNSNFWLIQQPPIQAAIPVWRERYLPLLRSLPQPFNSQAFADAASIPYPSANYILALFLEHGIIQSARDREFDAPTSFVVPRRRIVWGAPRRRVIVNAG